MIVASAASAPVFEGLRVGRGKPGAVRYHEFGRVLRGDGERRIGRRAHGFPMWELLGDEALRGLDLQPSDVEAGAGWPDEDEAELQTCSRPTSMACWQRTATYEDLEWLGASDAWLTRWWPRVEKQVREGLAPSTAEQPYPLVVDGALTLASGEPLRGGELLAPTLAGWQRFLELAPTSGAQVRRAARGGPRVLGPQVPARSARPRAPRPKRRAKWTAPPRPKPRPPASTRSRPRSCKPSSTATASAPGRTARQRRSIGGCSTTSCSSAPR
jgi:hypothetical protein